jgi:catechol 2,3-dioxygenase-like lactoylglutathione lyase family enzyme
MAAVLGTIAVFVMLFGLGLASWSIVVLGVALLALAVVLAMVNVVRRGARAWVAGTVQVKAVSQPPASSVYGRAELSVVVIAPGLPIQEVTIRDPRVPVEKWPVPGDTLPVTVDVDDMRRVRISWDDAPSRADSPDLNPPPPAYDLGDDDLSDDDLLGEPDPPPWATRDRQWGLGPDEPPPPPPAAPPSPRSGDDMDHFADDAVVVHDTPGGPVLEGKLVNTDDRPPTLPQRARSAAGRASGTRPSPHPRAATATVDPETEATARRSDDPDPSRTPEDSPQAQPAPPQAAAAPAPEQRRPQDSREDDVDPPPLISDPEPAPAPPSADAPSSSADASSSSADARAGAVPAASPSPRADPGPTPSAAATQAGAVPAASPPPRADPGPTPSAAATRTGAVPASAGPVSADAGSSPPAGAVPAFSRATTEPRPARPYVEPQPEPVPAVHPTPERPRAAPTPVGSTAPTHDDREIDLPLDGDPEPPPETQAAARNAVASDIIAPPVSAQSSPAQSSPAQSSPAQSSSAQSSPAQSNPTERQAAHDDATTPQVRPEDDAPVPAGEQGAAADAASAQDPDSNANRERPWARLEGGFQPDERADDLITAYPSARPGPSGAIHGIGITVLITDLERSIAFYRDVLGFFQIDSGTNSAVLASGDTRLVLRTVHDLSAEAGRLIYLNLEVGDVEAVYEELKSKGVTFVHSPRPVNRGEKLELWSASFSDPDNHNIAITQWRAIR